MLLMGMLGFLISAFLTYTKLIDVSWGFAFSTVFLILFVSAMISMTPDDKDIDTHDEETEEAVNLKNTVVPVAPLKVKSSGSKKNKTNASTVKKKVSRTSKKKKK
jgi:uncharacterized membrane protein